MRFDSPTVVVPYFTRAEDGRLARSHAKFNFSGNVDKRRVRRMIRRSFRQVGVHPSKSYLDYYIENVRYHG